jgi:hypothetical protein
MKTQTKQGQTGSNTAGVQEHKFGSEKLRYLLDQEPIRIRRTGALHGILKLPDDKSIRLSLNDQD